MLDKKFRELINQLEGVEEHSHFDKRSFKVNNKIFVTLNLAEKRACVKLSEIDQYSFCSYKKEVMYPVPNAYGKQGWTLISLEQVPDEMLEDALTTAYEYVKSGSKKGKKKTLTKLSEFLVIIIIILFYPFKAAAPPTISEISLVIAA